MVDNKCVKKQRKNPNDSSRFVKVTAITNDGEIAKNKVYELDEKAIEAEALYDGFYSICTNLTDDSVSDILSVSEGRWKIEESFRIMKTDFESRPVFVSREDRIKAHFLMCSLIPSISFRASGVRVILLIYLTSFQLLPERPIHLFLPMPRLFPTRRTDL